MSILNGTSPQWRQFKRMKTMLQYLLMVLVALSAQSLLAAESSPTAADDQVRQVIEGALGSDFELKARLGDTPVQEIYSKGQLAGYAYKSLDFVQTPAYSGKPMNAAVVLDPEGRILAARIIEHHEPILLVGIPEARLHAFTDQFTGLKLDQRVTVGSTSDPNKVAVDGLSGATVTVMVANEIIMRSAHRVGKLLGLIGDQEAQRPAIADLKPEFEALDWSALMDMGAISKLSLSNGTVDDAFADSTAEPEATTPDARETPFIELYAAYLSAPTIGRNLLGEEQFEWLQSELKNDEHAIAVLAEGDYSFRGSGYVRGGIFDRLRMRQFGDTFNFRDLDYYRLSDVYAEGMPDFGEMAIFIVRQQYLFDPGAPWSLELTVKRAIGPLDSVFRVFTLDYQLPESLYSRPVVASEPSSTPATVSKAPELVEYDEFDQPLWVQVWYKRQFQIVVLGLGLFVLLAILFFQDWLVKKPNLLRIVRHGFLIYTLFFIGWYALGQLSIVNVLTFVYSLVNGFTWQTFLIDPMIFILWVAVAVIVLLWGRAVYCGWLCPFGALQELINEIARKFKVPQYNVPFELHQRLWAIKYMVLLVLFGVSLQSMTNAELLAEVEPFKTAITLRFDRTWPFVTYALALLVVNIFTRKVFCRYICPLGAALTIPSKFRIYDWLKRRRECGNPCRLCERECEVQAIHPDGKINLNECHYCLDCQVTYFDDKKCPPLILKNRGRRGRHSRKEPETIAVRQID